jgi:hypothetical protein
VARKQREKARREIGVALAQIRKTAAARLMAAAGIEMAYQKVMRSGILQLMASMAKA